MRPRATTTLYRVLAICCLCQVVLGDQPVAPERRYDLGPLTIDEFVGEVKPGSRAQANTATRVSYSYRYTLRQVGRRMVVSVTSIDLSAVFLPKDSWWADQAEAALLDHEQGHFDIAEINVRKTKLALAKAQAEGKSLSTTTSSQKAATDWVVSKMDDIRRLVDQQTASDNLEYDRATRHGTHAAKQHEMRRIQQLTLERLAAELEAKSPASTSRR